MELIWPISTHLISNFHITEWFRYVPSEKTCSSLLLQDFVLLWVKSQPPLYLQSYMTGFEKNLLKTYGWGTKQLGEVINRVESQHLQLIGHKYRSSIEKWFQPFGILVARNLLAFVALIIYILHFWKPSLKKNVRTKCRYREVVGKGLIVKDSDKGLMPDTSAYGCNNKTLYDMTSMTLFRWSQPNLRETFNKAGCGFGSLPILLIECPVLLSPNRNHVMVGCITLGEYLHRSSFSVTLLVCSCL